MCCAMVSATCLGLLYIGCAVNNNSRRFLQSTSHRLSRARATHTIPRVHGRLGLIRDIHDSTKVTRLVKPTRMATRARKALAFHVTQPFSYEVTSVVTALAFGILLLGKRKIPAPKLYFSRSLPSSTMAMASTTGNSRILATLTTPGRFSTKPILGRARVVSPVPVQQISVSNKTFNEFMEFALGLVVLSLRFAT